MGLFHIHKTDIPGYSMVNHIDQAVKHHDVKKIKAKDWATLAIAPAVAVGTVLAAPELAGVGAIGAATETTAGEVVAETAAETVAETAAETVAETTTTETAAETTAETTTETAAESTAKISPKKTITRSATTKQELTRAITKESNFVAKETETAFQKANKVAEFIHKNPMTTAGVVGGVASAVLQTAHALDPKDIPSVKKVITKSVQQLEKEVNAGLCYGINTTFRSNKACPFIKLAFILGLVFMTMVLTDNIIDSPALKRNLALLSIALGIVLWDYLFLSKEERREMNFGIKGVTSRVSLFTQITLILIVMIAIVSQLM